MAWINLAVSGQRFLRPLKQLDHVNFEAGDSQGFLAESRRSHSSTTNEGMVLS